MKRMSKRRGHSFLKCPTCPQRKHAAGVSFHALVASTSMGTGFTAAGAFAGVEGGVVKKWRGVAGLEGRELRGVSVDLAVARKAWVAARC